MTTINLMHAPQVKLNIITASFDCVTFLLILFPEKLYHNNAPRSLKYATIKYKVQLTPGVIAILKKLAEAKTTSTRKVSDNYS